MAAKKPSPQFDFIVEQLKKNPNAAYAEIAAAAQKKGMKAFPIMFGRAKAMLGLVPSAPGGAGKATRKKAAATEPAWEGVGQVPGLWFWRIGSFMAMKLSS